jgi:transposase
VLWWLVTAVSDLSMSTWRFGSMAFREVRVVEVREVLRAWLSGDGLRTVAERSGVDRKTARRYVQAAEEAGVVRDGGLGQVTDEVIGRIVSAVRPARPAGHGRAWALLLAEREQITTWVGKDLTVVKIGVLLERRGVAVPYRTLYRFCVECCGFGRGGTTVRVADGEPGVECQIDFGKMGMVYDPVTGRRRTAHALIFTAVYSRHMFVWLSFSQTLEALVAGCEAAWVFFGGVFKIMIPDNMAAIVAAADPVNPRFTVGWLDYAQHCGFGTDPARVRSPKDRPRVERTVQYVRSSCFAGEEFVDLVDAQARTGKWCALTAGMRIHGTTQARPAEMFAEHEAGALLPVPGSYDVPIFKTVKVHRDYHIFSELDHLSLDGGDFACRAWGMPRLMSPRVGGRRSSWASLSWEPARLIWSPSISPSHPSRSASAMRASRLSRISARRSRWVESGHSIEHRTHACS